jgi:hypothetical protein
VSTSRTTGADIARLVRGDAISVHTFEDWWATQRLPASSRSASRAAWAASREGDDQLLRQALNALEGMCSVAIAARSQSALKPVVVVPSDITRTIIERLRERLDPCPF